MSIPPLSESDLKQLEQVIGVTIGKYFADGESATTDEVCGEVILFLQDREAYELQEPVVPQEVV